MALFTPNKTVIRETVSPAFKAGLESLSLNFASVVPVVQVCWLRKFLTFPTLHDYCQPVLTWVPPVHVRKICSISENLIDVSLNLEGVC